MVERRMIVDDLNIAYEGLFDMDGFFKLIENWFKDKDYKKNEIRHTERVREKGKWIDFEVVPTKEVSDYTKYEIDVRIRMQDLKDAMVQKGDKKFKITKGKFSISIDAHLRTDIHERWEAKPTMFFLRTLFDKYVNKQYMDKFEKGLVEDVQDLHSELKAFLNLNRYNVPA